MTVGARGKGEEGFVLVVVIFLTALIALLAIGLAVSVRSHVRLTANTLASAQAEALADGGIQLAVLSLVAMNQSRERSGRFPTDGQPSTCSLGTAQLTIRIQDSSGRVSLNLAGERLLMALFIGLGASLAEASRATDLIIDYRDADSDRRLNGAELPEYVAAGQTGPKNAPFDTVEETGRILGIDLALMAKAAPHLTVYSQTAGIDPRWASSELIDILARGIDQLPTKIDPGFISSGKLPAEFVTGSPQRTFHVSSEVRDETGAVFVRQTVLELQSTRTSLPVFKSWSRGELGPASATADAAMPRC